MEKEITLFESERVNDDNGRLFTGRVKCTHSRSDLLTTGKVYEVVDGVLTFDDCTKCRREMDAKTFDDFQKHFASSLKEVKDDNGQLYTGLVECELTCRGLLMVCNLYDVVDGVLTFDNGTKSRRVLEAKTFRGLASYFSERYDTKLTEVKANGVCEMRKLLHNYCYHRKCKNCRFHVNGENTCGAQDERNFGSPSPKIYTVPNDKIVELYNQLMGRKVK